LAFQKSENPTWNHSEIYVAYDEANLPGKTAVKYRYVDEHGRRYR